MLQLPKEDVAEIEHRLDVQSAQSAATVLPTGLPDVWSNSSNTPTSSPLSSNPPLAIPSTEIPTTKIPAAETPTAEIPATKIPSTKIPSAEIPSSSDVNQPANLTGVKGQMVKRKMDMDVASPANSPPDDSASQKHQPASTRSCILGCGSH